MSTILRHAVRGFILGVFATALVLLWLPHFYSHVYELIIVPVILAVPGVVLGTIARLTSRMRRQGNATTTRPGKTYGITVVAALVLVILLYALRSPARSWTVSPKMIALCIDGGTWDIADPLLAAGKLPNLERLQRQGTSATLMASEPSWSMIAWTTIGTGVTPEKHGIQSFYDTQDHLRAKRFWEVFEDNGHSIGLFRYWITWPPHVRNGFVVPDILARDAESFPPRLNFINQFRLDIKSRHARSFTRMVWFGWKFLRSGLRMETCLQITGEMVPALASGRYADFHIAARRAEIRLNADLYCHLLREERPEYTCFYDNGVDQMSHFYWQYFQPESFGDIDPDEVKRYGGVIPDYYVLTDEVIGNIIDHVEESASVFVLSDHGFTADTSGQTNWLFPNGVSIIADLGIDDDYYSIALGSRTFIGSISREPAARQAALERALALFDSLKVEETGAPLFSPWIEDEHRVQLDVSDSLRTLEGHVRTPTGLVPLEKWFTIRVYAGTHDPAGIIIAKGEAFRSNYRGVESHQINVAPTVLYTSGFALSRELDGSVVLDWITPEFAATNEIKWVDSYGGYDPLLRDTVVDKETLERLRSLGYIR